MCYAIYEWSPCLNVKSNGGQKVMEDKDILCIVVHWQAEKAHILSIIASIKVALCKKSLISGEISLGHFKKLILSFPEWILTFTHSFM